MNPLLSIGFSEYFQSRLPPSAVPVRIAAVLGSRFLVWDGVSERPARRGGRLADTPLGVGDWTWLRGEDAAPGSEILLEGLLPRRTVFLRGAAGGSSQSQVVAANVDLVFIVTDMDRDFNLRRLERYLVVIRAGGASPRILLNKQDLCDDPERFRARVEERCPGVPVTLASALQDVGLEALMGLDLGVTAALVGSSGVGKSTFVNRLLRSSGIETRPVAQDGRGRHTTTRRQLYRLPGGGILLDTPGMRELALPGEEGLEEVFDDIVALGGACRYRDCQHQGEPGCAVQDAVDRGSLDGDRLRHFLQLKHEARKSERRQDERLRREDDRTWGRHLATLKHQIRRKRGDWG